jgi:hypothetical protein
MTSKRAVTAVYDNKKETVASVWKPPATVPGRAASALAIRRPLAAWPSSDR